MKKAKSWLALPLAVCMFAVMIFSVAEAAETSDENPAEGRQEITIITRYCQQINLRKVSMSFM